MFLDQAQCPQPLPKSTPPCKIFYYEQLSILQVQEQNNPEYHSRISHFRRRRCGGPSRRNDKLGSVQHIDILEPAVFLRQVRTVKPLCPKKDYVVSRKARHTNVVLSIKQCFCLEKK